jgi:hypothetical protein
MVTLLAGGCRHHGPLCRTPWGYDRAHTDQRYPYTAEQLAVRKEVPHRYAYPSTEEYLTGWRLWLALRRDSQLAGEEAHVAHAGRAVHLARRTGRPGLADAIARFAPAMAPYLPWFTDTTGQ